jgi:hypothetical protein
MEYVVIKTLADEDIIGRLRMVNDKELTLEDPCYVNIKLKANGIINFGMMRVTLLADKHELSIPVEKVLTYYPASDIVSKYYNKVISDHILYHDETFKQLLDDHMNYNDYEEVQDEGETELIKTYMEKLLQANTSIH